MNEQEHIIQFNSDLDRVIYARRSHQDVGETDPLIQVALLLAETDLSHESTQLEAIRARLLAQVTALESKAGKDGTSRGEITMRRNKFLRAFAMSAAIFAVLSTTVLTIPPLRALAQELMAQIGLFQFTNEQTIAQEKEGQLYETPEAGTPFINSVLSIDIAGQQAGFGIYEPRYMPSGYVFSSRSVDDWSDRTGIEVRSDFMFSSTDRQNFEPDFITLHQIHFDDPQSPPIQWPIGDTQPVEVIINSHIGIWLENTPTGYNVSEDNTYEVLGVNILTWEQDGYTFYISNLNLGLDELLHVAESLAP